MSELNSAVSQPAVTNWLSGAFEALIRLESCNDPSQPASATVLGEMHGLRAGAAQTAG